jgi:hypothetical protein
MGTIFFGQARSRFIHGQHDRCAGIWEEGAVEVLSLWRKKLHRESKTLNRGFAWMSADRGKPDGLLN